MSPLQSVSINCLIVVNVHSNSLLLKARQNCIWVMLTPMQQSCKEQNNTNESAWYIARELVNIMVMSIHR